MRKPVLFCLLLMLYCLNAIGQLTHDGRGLYVDRFFRTSPGPTGAPIVDVNFSILSIAAKENALLEYARNNHITYLILYDLHRVLGNTTYETYLCNFIQKAKTQYCIEKIGVASSCASMFANVASMSPSPPVTIPDTRNSDYRDRLRFVTRPVEIDDPLFMRAEVAKLTLNSTAFNDACSYKLDVMVTEYEFWNGGTDNCTEQSISKDQKFQNFQTMITDMDLIRDSYNATHANHKMYVETYLGYLNQNTAYTHQAIADWIDGSYNGKRRIDRINLHYYGTDPSRLYSRTAAGTDNTGYYLTRFLDFSQGSTNDKTNSEPIFSAENTNWGGLFNFLGSWFNQGINNNIFTAEKKWYNDWFDDANQFHQSTIGDPNKGTVIYPGAVTWFAASQLVGHLDTPVLFTSNSPVCVDPGMNGAFQFQFQGPIETGTSFRFFITEAGTNVIRCGTQNDQVWPAYNASTQTSLNLNAALGGCSLPAGDYDAHLELNYDSGCYIYQAPPVRISIVNTGKIVALTQTTACQGNPVYLQASSTGAGTTTYAWYDGSTPVSGATNAVFAATSTGTHNYSCLITSTSGTCSANRSNIIPVTINTYPSASITVQSNLGCSTILKANPTGANYVWQNGTSSSTFTAAFAGTYSVSVSQNGCSKIATYNYTKVKAELSNKINPCNGGSGGSITLNLFWGTWPYTLSWSGASSGIVSALSPGLHTVSNLAAGNYTFTVTDVSGCTYSLSTSLTQQTVAVTSGVSAPVCIGGNISLTSSGGVSYSWNGPNNFSSTQQNPVITNVTLLNAGPYIVTVTGSNGCTATSSVVSVVNSKPAAIASIDTSLCSGRTLHLSSGGGTSYSWSGPGNYSSTNQNDSILSATLSNSGMYIVTVTNQNGCSATASVTSNVLQSPAVNATSSSPACPGDTITLNATGSAANYSWNGPNGFSSSQASPNLINVQLTDTGIYAVVAAAANGCTSSTSTNVVVHVVDEVIAVNDGPVCSGDALLLSSSPGSNHSWNGPSGFTSSLQGPVIQSADSGNAGIYMVTITDDNGCVSSATTSVYVNVLPFITVTDNGPLCEGDILKLYADGGVDYSWTGPHGYNSSLQNPSISDAGPADDSVYVVTVVDSNGCVSSSSIDVTIFAALIYFADADSDGFGSTNNYRHLCNPLGIYTTLLGGDCNDNNSSVHPGAVEICNNGIDEDCNGIVDDSCNVVLNLRIFIEGFYRGNGEMVAVVDPITYPGLCDTILVELHDFAPPHALHFTGKGTLDTAGFGSFTFPFQALNQSFFIVVRHRNSLETWSATPVLLGQFPVSYDFTAVSSNTFGNNLADLGDGFFGLLSGDITNQNFSSHDGYIDLFDLAHIRNSMLNFLTGYVPDDLNGDGIVESSDYSIMENNVSRIVTLSRP